MFLTHATVLFLFNQICLYYGIPKYHYIIIDCKEIQKVTKGQTVIKDNLYVTSVRFTHLSLADS